MPYERYVAVGDSQTEGLNDGTEETGYRGWADRFAELLAADNPGLEYANLAVRGRLTARIRAEQTEPALAMKPDLITVMSGMNDLVRPGFDVDAVCADLDTMLRVFTASGATVVTFTFPDVAKIAPLVRHLRPKVLDLNDRIRAMAGRYGAIVVDTFEYPITTDPRLWSTDRIHASPLGHARIAAATAHALKLPGSDLSWTEPLPGLPPVPAWRRASTEAGWAGTFLGPWILRRLRGRSSGDGHFAKRPELAPVASASTPDP
ncbi:SGNH/GDSL hydrolase family protein [Actinomadura barringtoniae]|uniref:SGNH/GDSL hydrolase family protein n=1 Tax=Actinomadura barringtoniae TaxID=1427535 RepID=A0A939TAI6_9ACTN|nr:SGNH/GDSL hydrolase family protein [Actinomadura barringtoniae]MBO2455454.1 SGNH/GDSL hydrolase family protein [Actinomadura barringtoniae]